MPPCYLVNGEPMTIVLDDVENIEREKKMKSHTDGIYTLSLKLKPTGNASFAL